MRKAILGSGPAMGGCIGKKEREPSKSFVEVIHLGRVLNGGKIAHKRREWEPAPL